MSMRIARRTADVLAIGTMLGGAVPATQPATATSPLAQSKYQTLYSQGFYTAARDVESNICFLRGDFMDGTRLIIFFNNQRVIFSVSNPDWTVSTTSYALDLQFLPGNMRKHFDSLSRNNSGQGVSVSLSEGTYVEILNAIKRGSTLVATIGGREKATMTLAHAAGAVDAFQGCDSGIKKTTIAPTAPRTSRSTPAVPGTARPATPAPAAPQPSSAEIDRKLTEAIDAILRRRSQSWIVNRYDYNSVHNVTMVDDGKASGVTKVRAEYTYNGGMPGWVILESRGKDDLCLRFWDFQNICR